MKKLVCKYHLKCGVLFGGFFMLKAGNCKYEIWEPLVLTSIFLVSLYSFLPVLCCSGCWRLGNNGISVVWPRLVDGPWVNCPPVRRMPLCCCSYGCYLYECDVRNTVVANEQHVVSYGPEVFKPTFVDLIMGYWRKPSITLNVQWRILLWLADKEFKKNKREKLWWPNLRCCPGSCLEGLRKPRNKSGYSVSVAIVWLRTSHIKSWSANQSTDVWSLIHL
jgi:hypothetical protein